MKMLEPTTDWFGNETWHSSKTAEVVSYLLRMVIDPILVACFQSSSRENGWVSLLIICTAGLDANHTINSLGKGP